MYRVDKLIQTRTLVLSQRPRDPIAAAGVNAHLLWGRHGFGNLQPLRDSVRGSVRNAPAMPRKIPTSASGQFGRVRGMLFGAAQNVVSQAGLCSGGRGVKIGEGGRGAAPFLEQPSPATEMFLCQVGVSRAKVVVCKWVTTLGFARDLLTCVEWKFTGGGGDGERPEGKQQIGFMFGGPCRTCLTLKI